MKDNVSSNYGELVVLGTPHLTCFLENSRVMYTFPNFREVSSLNIFNFASVHLVTNIYILLRAMTDR